MDKFRSYLEGQPIIVRTDHLPLVGSLTKKADTALPIPRRHLLKIAQFVDQLYYLKGERNVVADALSRITVSDVNQSTDSLPEEGSPQAVTDDALVDDTILFRLSNQRDLEQRQLSAPAFVPTKASSTANKPNSVTNETNASSATSGEDSCASSVRACNAIFALQSTTVAQIPTAQRMRDEQERDASLQKWIKHHTLSSSQFTPQLTECENGTQVWADVTATYTRILVPTSLRLSIFDSLHSLSHPVWRYLRVFTGGVGLERTLANGPDHAKLVRRRKFNHTRKLPLRVCLHQLSASVMCILTWLAR